MAWMYFYNRKNNKAIEQLKLACKEQPESFAAIKALAFLQVNVKPGQAVDLVKEFIERKGFDTLTLDDQFAYAQILEMAGNKYHPEAKKVVEGILENDQPLSDYAKTRLNNFLTDLGGHSVKP
jgi:hypothetical protein